MSHHGKIWWTELNTWDAAKAREYYGAVMGWTFDEVATAGSNDYRPYYIAKKDGQPVAGIFSMPPEFKGIPDHWFTYVAVDDLDKAIAQGKANGGQCMREPFEIPGFGTLAIVKDSNGAAVAFIQPVPE